MAITANVAESGKARKLNDIMKKFTQLPFKGADGKMVTDSETLDYWSKWRGVSGHPKGWRVSRGIYPSEDLEGKSGKLILFKSFKAAQKRAHNLNEMLT